MGAFGIVMSEAEVSALRETLCTQQKLLQTLHNDLEAEREASATAASEALSVILRLQGEKAAVKMEAEQYKRLAEEKICHAEESFAIIEDIITDREMEVADLEYQVQTYRYKLLSMGWVDPAGTGENIFPGNLVLRNGKSVADSSLHSIALARRNSEPTLIMPDADTQADMELISKAPARKQIKLGPRPTQAPKIVEKPLKKTKELNDVVSNSDKKIDSTYTDQIKKLDILVKELAEAKYPPSSRNEANNVAIVNETERTADSPQKCVPPGVLDVFEVPQVDKDCSSDELTQEKEKIDSLGNESCQSKDVKQCGKEDNDWLKKLLQSVQSDKHICKPSNVAAIECGVVTECGVESVHTVKQLEIADSSNRDEEIKLLKEIKEELSLLKNEIRSRKEKKQLIKDTTTVPVCEAMLHFWL